MSDDTYDNPSAGLPPFPLTALGAPLADIARATHRRFQSPDGMVPTAMMGAALAYCQRHYMIELPTGSISPTIPILVIAPSGCGKTPLMREFFAPLRAMEEEDRQAMPDKESEYQARLVIHKSREKHAKRQHAKALKSEDQEILDKCEEELIHLVKAKPIPPKARRWLTDDFTPSSLFGLIQAHRGVVIGSDEGPRLFGAEAGTWMTMINLASDNAPIHEDRITRGSAVVTQPRIGCFVMTQPAPFRQFLGPKGHGRHARDNGYLPRALIYQAGAVTSPREMLGEFPKTASQAWFSQRAFTLLRQSEQGLVCRLSPTALTLWLAFVNEMNERASASGDLAEFSDVAAKLPNNAVRLAAMMEFFVHEATEIRTETLQNCIEICRWYLLSFKRLFEVIRPVSTLKKDAEDLLNGFARYTRKKFQPSFGLGEVQNAGPKRLRKQEGGDKRFQAALALLESLDVVAATYNPSKIGLSGWMNARFFSHREPNQSYRFSIDDDQRWILILNKALAEEAAEWEARRKRM